MTEVRDPFRFLDLLTGYQPATVIMAAHRLGVFGALHETPATSEELATTLGVDAGSLGALLRALVAIGLAAGDDGAFSSTEFTRVHLADGSDLALVIPKEEYFLRGWLDLPEAVRSGRPVLPTWVEVVESTPDTAAMFLEALNVLAEHTGPALWEMPELAPGKRVLDVGGGFAHYAQGIVDAGSQVVLVDLPAVVAELQDRLEGVSAIELVAHDILGTGSCGVEDGSFDVALVSHMLHDLDFDSAVSLLRAVRQTLTPGGTVVVNDFAGDVGPGAFGAMFDVMMRVETGGAAHSLDDLLEMVKEAGFEDVHRVAFEPPVTVLKGAIA